MGGNRGRSSKVMRSHAVHDAELMVHDGYLCWPSIEIIKYCQQILPTPAYPSKKTVVRHIEHIATVHEKRTLHFSNSGGVLKMCLWHLVTLWRCSRVYLHGIDKSLRHIPWHCMHQSFTARSMAIFLKQLPCQQRRSAPGALLSCSRRSGKKAGHSVGQWVGEWANASLRKDSACHFVQSETTSKQLAIAGVMKVGN